MLQALPWKDIITISTASVGAVLGLLNTWNTLNQRRVRLVVRPAYAFRTDGGASMTCIEVTNLSGFALTITEIGFTDRRGAKRGKRWAGTPPVVIDGKPWPRRLEPRSAVTGYLELSQLPTDPGHLAKAYAKTECGVYAYGTSPALTQLRQKAKQFGQKD